jgi:hypothetical protein
MTCASCIAAVRSSVSVTDPPDTSAAARAFDMIAGGSSKPSGRSTVTSMPRIAAMWTVAEGTARGSAFGW